MLPMPQAECGPWGWPPAGGGKQPLVTSKGQQGKEMLQDPGLGVGGLRHGLMDGERGLAAGPVPVSITLPLPQPQTPAGWFLEIFVKCRQFS